MRLASRVARNIDSFSLLSIHRVLLYYITYNKDDNNRSKNLFSLLLLLLLSRKKNKTKQKKKTFVSLLEEATKRRKYLILTSKDRPWPMVLCCRSFSLPGHARRRFFSTEKEKQCWLMLQRGPFEI